MFLDKSNAENS